MYDCAGRILISIGGLIFRFLILTSIFVLIFINECKHLEGGGKNGANTGGKKKQ